MQQVQRRSRSHQTIVSAKTMLHVCNKQYPARSRIVVRVLQVKQSLDKKILDLDEAVNAMTREKDALQTDKVRA